MTALHVLGVAARPCVVIADLVMPYGDGAELARALAALAGVRDICITGGRGELPDGCHAMLRKPFDAAALARPCAALSRRCALTIDHLSKIGLCLRQRRRHAEGALMSLARRALLTPSVSSLRRAASAPRSKPSSPSWAETTTSQRGVPPAVAQAHSQMCRIVRRCASEAPSEGYGASVSEPARQPTPPRSSRMTAQKSTARWRRGGRSPASASARTTGVSAPVSGSWLGALTLDRCSPAAGRASDRRRCARRW